MPISSLDTPAGRPERFAAFAIGGTFRQAGTAAPRSWRRGPALNPLRYRMGETDSSRRFTDGFYADDSESGRALLRETNQDVAGRPIVVRNDGRVLFDQECSV